MQPHPELNHTIIKDGIIDRLHRMGRLDERQKRECVEWLFGGDKPIRRHIMLRIIGEFIGI